jgi:hypothetical protein
MSCKKIQTMQTELNALLNNTNATSQNYEDFYKKWGIDYSVDATVKNISQCSLANAAASSNKISITQECVDAAVNLCLSVDGKGAGSPNYDECWKLYRPTMRGIQQSNVNKITSNCMVSSILKDPILKKSKELALLLNMKLAEQQINCDDTKNNSINNALSSEEKIFSLSSCINNNIIKQQNIISGCHVSNAVQNNISDVISNCSIKSGDVPLEDHKNPNFITSDTNSSIDQINKKSNSNIFDNYYILIGGISCCCLSIIIIIIFIIIKKK